MPGNMMSIRATSVGDVGEQVEGFLAARHVLHLVALTLEGQAHGRTDPFVVFDYQNASTHSNQLIQICVGQMEPPIIP